MNEIHCKEGKKWGTKIKGKPTLAKKTMLNQIFKKNTHPQDLIGPLNFSTIFKTIGVLRTPHHNLSNHVSIAFSTSGCFSRCIGKQA